MLELRGAPSSSTDAIGHRWTNDNYITRLRYFGASIMTDGMAKSIFPYIRYDHTNGIIRRDSETKMLDSTFDRKGLLSYG